MPAYRVEIQRSAERDLDRLSATLFERVAAAVDRLAEELRPVGSEKLAGLDAYRVRVGDYGVIFEVLDRDRLVVVTRVRHRREVYRRLR